MQIFKVSTIIIILLFVVGWSSYMHYNEEFSIQSLILTDFIALGLSGTFIWLIIKL